MRDGQRKQRLPVKLAADERANPARVRFAQLDARATDEQFRLGREAAG
jgi:hypothetical protein